MAMDVTTGRKRRGGATLLGNRTFALAAGLLALLVLAILLAPLIAGFDPARIMPRQRLLPPDALHWFGTDVFGRDVFSRVLYGGRLSLLIGLTVAAIAGILGTLIGLLCGASRLLDAIAMRVMDGVMALPGILVAIAVVSLVGADVLSIAAAIAFPEIPRVARLVRSVILTVREETYVRAAEGLGIPAPLVLLRHILPSCIAPLVVQVTFVFATAILTEAVLGFLGVGFPPDMPTWGNVLAEGRSVFERAPWTVLFPGLFLALTVLAVNVLGDAVRDRLDPRLSRSAKAAG